MPVIIMITAELQQPAPAIMTNFEHSQTIRPQLHIKTGEQKKKYSAKES